MAQSHFALGITIGKFYPFHRGHELLISKAREVVDHLVVICSGRDGDAVSSESRADWIRWVFPQADVEVITTLDDLPEAPDVWAKRALSLLNGRLPNVAFTGGESYGQAWASCMGCQHISLNTRITAATELRADLALNWDWLTPPAKGYFCKRVVLTGSDSASCVKLGKRLAEHYGTSWVPEYEQSHGEGKVDSHSGHAMTDSELSCIKTGQQRLEDDLAKEANRVLFCSTDPLSIHVRNCCRNSQSSLQSVAIAETRDYDLYIIISASPDCVQDNAQECIWHEMRAWLAKALETRTKQVPCVLLSGNCEQLCKDAMAVIDPLLKFPFLPLSNPVPA